MHQRKNMTAQQRNGTTNSSPRSAVRRSRPSFLRFTASRTDFRRTVGETRSKKRGRGNGNGRGAGQHAPAPEGNGLPALQAAAFSRRRNGKLRTKRRTTASRKRPAREGRADANTAQGPEKKKSGPAALRAQSPARNRPKEADGPDAGKTPETESARTKRRARSAGERLTTGVPGARRAPERRAR